MYPFVLIAALVGGVWWYRSRQPVTSAPTQTPAPKPAAVLRTIPQGGPLPGGAPEVSIEVPFVSAANLASAVAAKWKEIENSGQVQFGTNVKVDVNNVGTVYVKFMPGGFGGNASYAFHATRNGQSKNGSSATRQAALKEAISWLMG